VDRAGLSIAVIIWAKVAIFQRLRNLSMAFGEYFALFIMRLLAHIAAIVKANILKMIMPLIALLLSIIAYVTVKRSEPL